MCHVLGSDHDEVGDHEKVGANAVGDNRVGDNRVGDNRVGTNRVGDNRVNSFEQRSRSAICCRQ